MNSIKRPYWKPRFLELALRGIIKVHHNYIIWNVGQPGFGSRKGYTRLNQGRGLELAAEGVVCDSITQEIISSNLLLGHYRANKTHLYKLEREIPYNEKNSEGNTQYVDITIKKKRGSGFREQVFIEAKRINPFKTTFNSDQRKDVLSKKFKSDINKLSEEWEYWKRKLTPKQMLNYVKHVTKNYRPCLLLWGLYEPESKKYVHPDDILTEIKSHTKCIAPIYSDVRWYPLKWIDKGNKKSELKVTRWLWVNLIELTF